MHIRVRMRRFYSIVVPCYMVVSTYIPLLAHRPAILTVIWVRDYIKSISKTNFLPITISNSLVFPYISWTSPATVILHPTINIIRKLIIYSDMVKLRNRKVSYKTPAFASIVGNIESAIISI